MRIITYFPLWLIVIYWLLWNPGRSRAERLSALESQHRITLLEYFRRSLPVPRGWFERLVVSRVLLWIDRELQRAATRPAGISRRALRLAGKKADLL